MDPEAKEYIKKMLELTEENNAILRKMRSSMRWNNVIKAVYWIIVIGISIGALYYIQPYLNQLISIYSGLGDIQNLIPTQ